MQMNQKKMFLKYVSFNILSMVGLSCYIFADTLFIAAGAGSRGLAALNLALPVFSFMNGIGLMLGMGAATKYSILRAEGKTMRANQYFVQAMIAAAVLGVLLTVTGLCFSGQITRLLGADQEVGALTERYLGTLMSFSAAFLLNNVLVCFVRNDGKPNLSMAAMLAGSFSNIILDYLFIFPMGLGMTGAALATGLAPVISMAVLSLHKLRGNNCFHLKAIKWEWHCLGRTAGVGAASFINEFSAGVVMLLFNFVILRLAGNTGVAAYGVVANLSLIVMAVFTGIAQGIQPIVSTSFGKKEFGGLLRVGGAALLLAVCLGAAFYLTGLLFPKQIVGMFNGAGDAQLQEIAEKGIRLYFTAFLIMGLNIVASAFFAAVARQRQSTVVSVLRGFGAVLPFLAVLSLCMGMTGVFLAVPFAEGVTAALSLKYLHAYRRQAEGHLPTAGSIQ